MEELFKALGALPYTAEEDAERLRALQKFAPAQLAAKLRKVHDRRFELLRKFPELRDPTIGPSHPQAERLAVLDRRIKLYKTAIEKRTGEKSTKPDESQRLTLSEPNVAPQESQSPSTDCVAGRGMATPDQVDEVETASNETGLVHPQPATAANDAIGAEAGRHSEVNAFLLRCNEIAPVKIIRTHIWRAVGHKRPRQFQYWQAGQDRLPGTTRGATAEDQRNFRRILAMNPADFIELIKNKGLIQAKP